jgi:predicted nucleic acid-binding protein
MRPRVVLDASAALLCVLDEPGSRRAEALLERLQASVVLAPDLWLAEVANAVWKSTRRRLKPLSPELAAELLDALLGMPIRLLPHTPLTARSLDIALLTGLRVHDALYCAATEREAAELVTLDRRLAGAAVALGLNVHTPA